MSVSLDQYMFCHSTHVEVDFPSQVEDQDHDIVAGGSAEVAERVPQPITNEALAASLDSEACHEPGILQTHCRSQVLADNPAESGISCRPVVGVSAFVGGWIDHETGEGRELRSRCPGSVFRAGLVGVVRYPVYLSNQPGYAAHGGLGDTEKPNRINQS